MSDEEWGEGGEIFSLEEEKEERDGGPWEGEGKRPSRYYGAVTPRLLEEGHIKTTIQLC